MSQATSGRQDTRRSYPEPLPADANGKRLCELFNYPWQFITATLDHPHYKPKWETITRYPLRPRNLWTQWQDPNQLIGVRFGHTTTYALIDIDANSQYLNASAIADLQYALETIGICRVLILRSSWSGGLHIYLPLPEAVNTFSLACTLKHSLTAQGFDIAPGQLELFPNVKAWANHHRGESLSTTAIVYRCNPIAAPPCSMPNSTRNPTAPISVCSSSSGTWLPMAKTSPYSTAPSTRAVTTSANAIAATIPIAISLPPGRLT